MRLLWFLLIGLVAGWLAGQLMKGGGYGLIGDLVLGVVGAFVGGWIFGALGISAGGFIGSLITATVGAVVLVPGPSDQESLAALAAGLANPASCPLPRERGPTVAYPWLFGDACRTSRDSQRPVR